MRGDQQSLLQRFVNGRSDRVFAELVRAHVDLVFSAARRMVAGDTHLAEDVTQTVFADLARKAAKLPRGVILSSWLYRHTFFVASSLVRTERRRRQREQEATAMDASSDNTDNTWLELESHLDHAMNELSAKDREALVLRFFDRLDLQSVGERIGIGEDAAQKRVSRAIEKLRKKFSRRGLSVSGKVLATTLLAHAVTTAPAAVATTTAATVAAGTAAGSGIYLTFQHFMSTQLIKPIVGAALVASVSVPLFIQHQSIGELTDQNAGLSAQVADLDTVRTENDRLSKLAVDYAELESLREVKSELLGLRGRYTLMRNELDELKRQLEKYRQRLALRNAEENAALTDEERQARRQVQIQTRLAGLPLDSDLWAEFGLQRPLNKDDEGGSVLLDAEAAERLIAQLLETEGVDVQFSPRMTTKNGRQTQIKTVEITTVITGWDGSKAETKPMEFGAVIDLIPTFLEDSEKLNLTLTTTFSEFVGYDDPGQFLTGDDQTVVPVPMPRFRMRQLTTDINVNPGQVLVLTGGYKKGVSSRDDEIVEVSRGLILIIQPEEILPQGFPVNETSDVAAANDPVPSASTSLQSRD